MLTNLWAFFLSLSWIAAMCTFIHTASAGSIRSETLVSSFIRLDHGVKMPRVGLGTAALQGLDASVVLEAASSGVRLIDTAQAPEWYSEERVGRGIRDYVSLSTERRASNADFFVITKIHPRSFGQPDLHDALGQSRWLLLRAERPLDLVLIHAPFCWQGHCTEQQQQQTWQTAWRHLEAAKQDGQMLGIGVSNFDATQLQELLQLSNTKVTAVQNWCDPFHQDRDTRRLAAEHGVQYIAYSSFGTQWGRRRNPVLESPELKSIAAAHDTSVTDVVLCWLLQEGAVAIPRSTSSQHIIANSLQHRYDAQRQAYRCFLTDEDLAVIRALDGTLGNPWD